MQQRKDNSIVASLFFFFKLCGLTDDCNNTMISHTFFFLVDYLFD